MTEDVEHIYAKLCDYLEGRLQPEERAEIDALLAADPQHAAIMTELAAQRQMLRRLPREQAPADLVDELRSQLERQAILDDAAPVPLPRGLGIGRWSGVLAAAAVVAAAVGLGLIVYSVLPSGRPMITIGPAALPDHRIESAEAADAASDALAQVDMKKAAAAPAEESGAHLRERFAAKGAADKPFSRGDPVQARGGAAHADLGVDNKGDGALAAAFADRAGKPGASAVQSEQAAPVHQHQTTPSYYMVEVVASEPSAAGERIVQYLTANSIAWVDQSGGTSQIAQATGLHEGEPASARKDSARTGSAAGAESQRAGQDDKTPFGLPSANGLSTAVAGKTDQPGSRLSGGTDQEARQTLPPGGLAGAGPEARRGAAAQTEKQAADVALANRSEKREAEIPENAARVLQARQQTFAAGVPSAAGPGQPVADRVILARNMTERQIVELTGEMLRADVRNLNMNIVRPQAESAQQAQVAQTDVARDSAAGSGPGQVQGQRRRLTDALDEQAVSFRGGGAATSPPAAAAPARIVPAETMRAAATAPADRAELAQQAGQRSTVTPADRDMLAQQAPAPGESRVDCLIIVRSAAVSQEPPAAAESRAVGAPAAPPTPPATTAPATNPAR